MAWLIVLGILVLLALLPVGISMQYNYLGFRLRAVVGFLKIQLIPRKKPRKATEEKAEEKPKASGTGKPSVQTEETKGGSLSDFMPLVRLGLELLNDLRRKVLVRHLDLELLLAGDDPCDLAVSYGKACAGVDGLIPLLERAFQIRKRHIRVGCDFAAEQTLVYTRIELVLPVYRILGLAVCYGVRAMKAFIKFKNLRKGGTVQ